jgi:hypothetical protein
MMAAVALAAIVMAFEVWAIRTSLDLRSDTNLGLAGVIVFLLLQLALVTIVPYGFLAWDAVSYIWRLIGRVRLRRPTPRKPL